MSESAPSDSELLADWLRNHSEPAFRALVARYAGLVHMAAKRTSGDETLASEASQLTFILLARKAKSLTFRSSLAGWLHHAAVMHSKNLLRQKRRESNKHKLLQSTMEIHQPDQHADQWKEMQPVLDEALSSLSEKDREALLLRFYRALTIREVAAALGIATDAAQKRIDRATERLRGKLAHRGCEAGVSLSAAMLVGFAADAQAALPVSALATKALATNALAASTFSALSLKTLFPTIVTLMKSTSIIPPIAALILASVFIGSKYQSLTATEQSNAALRNRIAAAGGSKAPATAASSKFIGADGAVDWKQVIEEIHDPAYDRGRSRALRLFEAYFASLEPWEMASRLQEIDALGLSPDELNVLEEFLMEPLSENAPGLGFSWRLANHPDDSYSLSRSYFESWAEKDLASATEWLDREIADGKFSKLSSDGANGERTSYESDLMWSLAQKDPAAISERLSSMPEGQRRRLVNFLSSDSATDKNWLRDLISRAPEEYMKLIRGNLPPEDQSNAFSQGWGWTIANSDYPEMSAFFPEMTAFFNMIQASPEERASCIQAATSTFINMYEEKQVTRRDLDVLRKWIGSQAPAAVDEITGEALGSLAFRADPSSLDQASALALHYHKLSGNDVILVKFVRLIQENRVQARILAGSIHDETLRERTLENLR